MSLPQAIEHIRVVCAWCSDVLVEAPPGSPTSHGICSTCKKRVLGEVETLPKSMGCREED